LASTALEQISQTLRPGDRRRFRRLHKPLWVDLFSELGQDRGDLVQPAGVSFVADQIDGCRLDRRDTHRSARCVGTLHRNLADPLSRYERDADGAAHDRSAVFRDGNLTLLRSMVRGAMVLSLHERWNELVRWQVAELLIRRGNGHAEPARRARHQPLFGQAQKGEFGRGR